jgi:putative sterol carrier protein
MKRLNRGKQLLLYAGPFPALVFFKLWASSSRGPGSLEIVALCMVGIILGIGLPFNLRFPDFYLRRLGLPTLKEQREMGIKEAKYKGSATHPEHIPESAREAIFCMPDIFNAEAAGDLKAVIGFVVHGAENFEAYLNIRDGACVLEKQSSGDPDLIIRTPSELWLAIARNEISGQNAFLARAYTADGNLGLLIRMKDLFSGQTRPMALEKPSREQV